MASRTDFPPVRACLFDMDGLLIDTEDIYTKCINIVLERYGRPNLPWSIKAKLQGRPAIEANKLFHDWAKLPISHDEYVAEFGALQREHFPGAAPLPGVETLLADLLRTHNHRPYPRHKALPGTLAAAPSHKVHLALATSSTTTNYALKTSHLPKLFAAFAPEHRILGDDPRVPRGRGKPLPDIYLVALEALNASLAQQQGGGAGGETEPPIRPEECLVFEDSVPGVEAGRRAGMRVVWCPHPMLKREYEGREAEVLAGRTGEAGEDVDSHTLGELGDGWGEYLPSLEAFPYARYGIAVPPPGGVLDNPSLDAQANVDVTTPEEVMVAA